MPSVKTLTLDTRASVKKELAVIRRGSEKAVASREAAQDFLYRAGIVTRTGKLRKPYG